MEPAGLLPAPHASKWSGRATSAPWVEVRTDCQGVSPHGSGLPGAAVAELPRAVVQSHGESMRRGGLAGSWAQTPAWCSQLIAGLAAI